MTLAVSRPCSESNSVETIAFALVFAESLAPAVLQSIEALLEQRFKEELPGAQRGEAQQMQVTLGGSDGAQPLPVSAAPELHDVARFLALPDGRFERHIQAAGNMLVFHSFKYTSFSEFKLGALKYVGAIVETLNPELVLQEVGLRVVDKFLYGPNILEENYRVSEIFKENSKYLTPAAYEAGLLWHVFQGWFEPWGGDGCKILNQLHLSNTNSQGIAGSATVIDHRAAFKRVNQSLKLGEILSEPLGLNEIMEKLHAGNKQALLELLAENKAREIGLRG